MKRVGVLLTIGVMIAFLVSQAVAWIPKFGDDYKPDCTQTSVQLAFGVINSIILAQSAGQKVVQMMYQGHNYVEIVLVSQNIPGDEGLAVKEVRLYARIREFSGKQFTSLEELRQMLKLVGFKQNAYTFRYDGVWDEHPCQNNLPPPGNAGGEWKPGPNTGDPLLPKVLSLLEPLAIGMTNPIVWGCFLLFIGFLCLRFRSA